MVDRAKFGEMVERRMMQYDNVLRMIEPLARNYPYTSEDATAMIRYMRQGIDKLESLFLSGGKVGGFRFSLDAGKHDEITDDPSGGKTADPTPIRKVR